MSLAVSPDQTMVVSGTGDGRLGLWNVKEGGVGGDPWESDSCPVTCLDWSPNAQEVANGSEDETGHGRVYTVKYSPRGDTFASGGQDNIIKVWSKDGKLLIEIKGHDYSVYSLCWSKDGAHIFSGSYENTIQKWRLIDGRAVVVLRGHTNTITSICLTSDERHLVSTSLDRSVRIWDLDTNEQTGDPLWHDGELFALAIPSDGRYIASAGSDKKIYVWSLEAALKQSGDQVRSDGKLKNHAPSSNDIFDSSPLPKRKMNFGVMVPRAPPIAYLPSVAHTPRRRNFSDFLYFRRPVDASPSIPIKAWRWNFSLFTGRIFAHTVDVAPARDDDRYTIAPPTEAEVAAAMQYAIDHAADSQASQGQAAARVQGSEACTQGQPASQPTQPVQSSSHCR
ncbi:WD40 repeat-like protein [Rhizopogon salebrosus TDB-379]|nr:WD40 repeat-like protein [Rhizopogon salebrosus TDB-379]